MRFGLVFLIILFPLFLAAQTYSGGLETQIYVTGFIPSLKFEKIVRENNAVNFRIGANLFDRRSFGEQDEERGVGYGLTVGYRRYHKENRSWSLGLRSGLWFNKVNWKNLDGIEVLSSGTSDVIAIQPTFELGHLFFLDDEGFFVNPTFSFGMELNLLNNGAQVRDGIIVLFGATVGKRF